MARRGSASLLKWFFLITWCSLFVCLYFFCLLFFNVVSVIVNIDMLDACAIQELLDWLIRSVQYQSPSDQWSFPARPYTHCATSWSTALTCMDSLRISTIFTSVPPSATLFRRSDIDGHSPVIRRRRLAQLVCSWNQKIACTGCVLNGRV